jgi:subtilisin family serine protease
MLALALSASSAVGAGTVQQLQPQTPAPVYTDTGAMVDETPAAWYVELSNPPIADGGSKAAVQKDKENFRASAQKAGINFKERYAYDTLFNGISLTVDKSQIPALARISGVKAIWPVMKVARPPVTEISEPELASALGMTGADVVQSELGFTGKGIKVAVMDTGIDYGHPDLGGCFGPDCRVAFGTDLVGDAYNADDTSPNYSPIPVPDPDPMDCAGHGTHVAGIIGARGQVTGVAPDVTFGAYRVFGCTGSTTDDIMLKAMEYALADGMQVLNMSIGSAFQWPQYPSAMASNRLVNKGMVVVASIGNSGDSGAYSAGAPGVGEKVIGVASYDNVRTSLGAFTISPDALPIGYTPAASAPPAPVAGEFPLVRTGTVTTTNDGCSALPAGSLTGKVALIRRGSCTFWKKAFNAQNAGAAGVVLYNNSAGYFSPTVAGTPAITIPVVATSNLNGALINSRLAAGPVTMTWTPGVVSAVNPTGGRISSFSSWGLSPDLALKPDIGAPGGMIRSTYPRALGSYASLSGTSMSSPHVAGAVALLLQARPNTPAQAVRSMLQNTADPKLWSLAPSYGILDAVHRQGAGMLQIDKAILATVKVEPGKLSLGESQTGPVTRSLTIANSGPAAVTYDLADVMAIDTLGIFPPLGYYAGPADVTFSQASVTVPAGGSATVSVTISPSPDLPDLTQYGGYVVLTPQGGGQTLRVPYAGFKGDYQAIVALSPTTYGFPWLAKTTGGSYAKQAAGAVFTMQGSDVPFFLLHLDHGVRMLRMEIRDAATGANQHRALNEDYVGQNGTATGFFAFPFDGTTMNGNKVNTVPNGNYVAVISVLKALGDENNPADWETWTSPSFTIQRP